MRLNLYLKQFEKQMLVTEIIIAFNTKQRKFVILKFFLNKTVGYKKEVLDCSKVKKVQ